MSVTGLDGILSRLQEGNLLDAEDLCRGLLDAQPRDAAFHRLAATIALRKGDTTAARRWAESALELQRDHVGALIVAGHAARASGDGATAATFFRRAMALAPERAEPAFMACLALLEQGDPAAQAILDHCLESFPDDASGWTRLGLALQTAGKLEAALAALTKAARAAPAAQLYQRCAAILQSLGRSRELVEALRVAERLEPSFEIAFQLGRALRDLGDSPSARNAFERAVAKDPRSGKAWFALGLVAEDMGDWPAAIAAYRRALETEPELAEAAVNLGAALQAPPGVLLVPCRIEALERPALRRARSPAIDKACVAAFGLLSQLLVAQRLDVIGVGWSTLIALLLRAPGLELHGAHLVGDPRQPRPKVILLFRQDMPAKNCKLARNRDRSDLMTSPGQNAHKEGLQRARRLGGRPGRFDQHRARMAAPDLADAPIVGRAQARLANARIESEVAHELSRMAEATQQGQTIVHPPTTMTVEDKGRLPLSSGCCDWIECGSAQDYPMTLTMRRFASVERESISGRMPQKRAVRALAELNCFDGF